MTDLQQLRELAQKATQLPRQVIRYDHGGGRIYATLPDGSQELIADTYASGDREFIAACSPDRILAMLDVCEAADGLSRGTDWNNGTQAGYYRKPLMEALARLRGPQ